MKFIFTLYICLVPLGFVMSQNEGKVDYDQLLVDLKADIKNGQHRTLRDLISLLDHPSVAQKVRKILQNHTFFLSEEVDVLQASKTQLWDFYYDSTAKIKYSEVLNAFFITPIEQRQVDFTFKHSEDYQSENTGGNLRRLLTNINANLENKKFDKAAKAINQIVKLKDIDKEVYLNILKDPRLFSAPESLRTGLYESLLNPLKSYQDIEIVEIVLQMLEGEFLEEDFAVNFLSNITNNTPELGTEFETNGEYFVYLADSLGSLEAIRSHGYERLFNSRMSFFQFPVDYYGKILAAADQYPWIKQNIIQDLKRTQHSRAFFYIAADLYKEWKEDPNFSGAFHFETLGAMTNLRIGIKGENNKTTFEPLEDEVSMTNYFFYWAAHYSDFEWDENRNIFTNKVETLAKTQSYERLFRRLNSRNDTIALESFAQLTEVEYLEIKPLAKKYRQLLRNQNDKIPSLKYKYLEQLSLLTEYCRLNDVSYKVKPGLAKKLLKLLAVESPMERYAIENNIIDHINLNEITGFEYWACLKEGDKNISYSAGRILDWVYSKNWDKILNDPNQLRLYLKKSYLFENIGVSGICNVYLNKFSPKNKSEQALLEEVGKIESDEDILNQISLLMSSDSEEDYKTYSIVDFLEDPLMFNRRDVKILPPPSPTDIKEIVSIIKEEQEPDVIKKLFAYLRLHPDIEYIPYLFELIDDERIVTKRDNITVSVSDNIIPIVENVYGHNFESTPQNPFPTKEWRALWKSSGPNFKNWEQQFFETKLDSLQYFDVLKIDNLNELTESGFYSEKYKESILKNLKKIKPIRNIRRLAIEPKLSVEDDLRYFKDFFFSYKELDDIPKLFDINDQNIDMMLTFLQEKSNSFEASEKGSLYNNLFRAPWLSRFINQGKLKSESAKIIETSLTVYLNESEFLSEFEEQMTQLNIAQIQFMGKNIQDKIDATIALDVDKGAKAKILKSIIATISYDEISLVVSRFDEMIDILGDKTYDFLSTDFGIPIFNFNTMKEQESFIKNHERLSEIDFYTFYLKKFGLDLFQKKGQLDYQNIYNILRFDIVSPFVGETGGKRDLYIYGVIKLLELHFDTRLGFHEKLNESQTFYSFSSTKRAKAWLEYLESKKRIESTGTQSPSFNVSREEF